MMACVQVMFDVHCSDSLQKLANRFFYCKQKERKPTAARETRWTRFSVRWINKKKSVLLFSARGEQPEATLAADSMTHFLHHVTAVLSAVLNMCDADLATILFSHLAIISSAADDLLSICLCVCVYNITCMKVSKAPISCRVTYFCYNTCKPTRGTQRAHTYT